jgi:hypothetical protein
VINFPLGAAGAYKAAAGKQLSFSRHPGIRTLTDTDPARLDTGDRDRSLGRMLE